jgi:hypothetical protein
LIGSARAVLTLLDDNHARSPTETADEAHRYTDNSPVSPYLHCWDARGRHKPIGDLGVVVGAHPP